MTAAERTTAMTMPWTRLRRSWRTRRASGLSESLAGQVQAALDGAALADAMVNKTIDPAEARRRIAEVEHRGDEWRAELVERLSKTLVAPLDREDLFRLSRSIDDILDTIRDFVREAHLYRIQGRDTYRPFVAAVVTAIESLAEAIDVLWSDPARVPLMALDVKKMARSVNREYQEEFAKIVDRAMTPQTLKHRELIKRLDWVGVRIGDAADVLTDGALKRGY